MDLSGKMVNEFRPYVPISISKWRRETLPFHALVDSGADFCLFPASFLEVLNIDVKKGKRRVVYGIGEHKIGTYAHKVNLDINGYKFKSTIYFSADQYVPLLGREGFFNKFKEVSFDQKMKKMCFKY